MNDSHDPILQFKHWLTDAEKKEPGDPNAMALATVGSDGMPSVRMVLLKDVDARGFVFYTNLESRKGSHLQKNPKAALCFHWKSLERQVRVEGPIEQVSDSEADAYFATRARTSRIGSWASQQSRPLAGRFELERRIAEFTARYAVGDIPRPSYWTGLRVRPLMIEFWKSGTFRLHDRLVFRRNTPGDSWLTEKLYP